MIDFTQADYQEMRENLRRLTPENETAKFKVDILSLCLFGKNYNLRPSKHWYALATEEELADWQTGDPVMAKLLQSRLHIQRKVEDYGIEQAEEEEGTRHYIPENIFAYELDAKQLDQTPIENFTMQHIRRSGSKKVTTCIFHDDSKPSCVLYQEKGFYCFSCGEGGGAIKWAMREFSMDFLQALEFLNKYN